MENCYKWFIISAKKTMKIPFWRLNTSRYNFGRRHEWTSVCCSVWQKQVTCLSKWFRLFRSFSNEFLLSINFYDRLSSFNSVYFSSSKLSCLQTAKNEVRKFQFFIFSGQSEERRKWKMIFCLGVLSGNFFSLLRCWKTEISRLYRYLLS